LILSESFKKRQVRKFFGLKVIRKIPFICDIERLVMAPLA